MAMLKVNGAAAPAPAVMKVTVFDVTNGAGRNAAGGAILDRVGVKRRLDLKWARLEGAQLKALLEAVAGGRFFTAVYPDPESGAPREMECSCGDRCMGVLRMEGGAPVWVDVEMSWTER